MIFLKMFGLIAAAAMALMAVGAAGSASATILTCTEGSSKVQCPKGTEIDASVEGTLRVTTPGLTVDCTEGTIKGSIEQAGSSTETASGITSEVTLEAASCSGCKTTMNNGTLEIHVTANANGTLTASGFTGTFNCFGLTCKYESGNNNDIGTITGSSNTGGTATIDLNETLIGESNGPGCGTGNVTWEGTYKITSPDWLDVDSTPPPPTTLTCTEGSSKVQCPEGTELDASVEETLKLTTPGITVTCTEGTIKGSIENPNRVKTSEVTFNSPSCTNCSTITVTSGTLEIHTENNGIPANGNGTLTASGLTFHFVCFGVTCNYITGNNNDIGTITGSSNTGGTATIDINTTLTKEEGSSFVCGSGNATLEGSYKVTSPDWLDVD